MHRDSNIGILAGFKNVYMWSQNTLKLRPSFEGLLPYLDDAMLYSLFLFTEARLLVPSLPKFAIILLARYSTHCNMGSQPSTHAPRPPEWNARL
jgi:hypothetical protein